MRLIGNMIWFIFSGFWACISWYIVGLILCLTIVGIPFGIQCFKIGAFGLFPFGKTIEIGQGAGSLLLNIIWIVCCGWSLAIMHLTSALLLCLTIVGIPFAQQSLKLAKISLFPFGAIIYDI
ncbi:TPA: YccF domain-containing protein [Streptococcus equi subsp. zooepidemicus]|nr:YccF domain-containing protein [Streptococcus equi subsp. zooepidemicus]HEL0466995.1 YccF domain-containing protein [Streptococcus equi subsp. zooepidemicus]HEL0483127.1 YccF domain-containing protein [Streptococcus equi subsp. zooepidemicus]HEL0487528.1 YccF domain-containing protein [Streptococcus equi subsp. zooepidemicus]HEL0490890.1 YccF domain-containing protein [Streptococcus equi subsp. zooepidemicus]